MTVSAVIGDELVRRPYSVGAADDPPGTAIEILVRRPPGGRLTTWLWEQPPGMAVHVSAAKGRLTLDGLEGDSVVMIATGSAIAPFAAIVGAAASTGRPRMVVVHGVARPADLAYRAVFEGGDPAARVRYIPVVSRPQDSPGERWAGRTGRVQPIVPELLGPAAGHDVAVLVCGNATMVRDFREIAIEHGVPRERIRTESYWAEARPSP